MIICTLSTRNRSSWRSRTFSPAGAGESNLPRVGILLNMSQGDDKDPTRGKRRHLHQVPAPTEPVTSTSAPADDDPMPGQLTFTGALRAALDDPSPIEFLLTASSIIAVLDPRTDNPTAPEPVHPDYGMVIDALGLDSTPESAALLAAMAVLLPDDLVRHRANRMYHKQKGQVPEWLARLGSARLERVLEIGHILHDGEDIVVSLRLATGQVLTIIVYIDHHWGSAVKDGFVTDEPAEAIQRQLLAAPDMHGADLDPAEARAKLAEAIELSASLYPPVETETWPTCRPLLEWAMRLMPTGGRGYERDEWSEEQIGQLARDFVRSDFATHLPKSDLKEIATVLIEFGIGWSTGDPLDWSPTKVELLLIDWIPDRLLVGHDFLKKIPEVMRAFVRFAHQRKGIGSYLTDETLTAINEFEPRYRKVIRTGLAHRLSGFSDLPPRRSTGATDTDELVFEVPSWEDFAVRDLIAEVGGAEQLKALDSVRLPDEEFDWTSIAEDIRTIVADVLTLTDRCTAELFDTEFRTACRRFLSRVAAADPQIFRRKASIARSAAAVCWTIARANHVVGRSGTMPTKDLLGWFGVSGSVTDRAGAMVKALGVDAALGYEAELGMPDLLVSARRKKIIASRDRFSKT